MALPKEIVSWPISGGLDTKTGPLSQQPGTFLQLDNVRQERRDEWRNRQGITHLNTDDDATRPALRAAELPGGGLVGLCDSSTSATVTGGTAYSRNLPGAGRWIRPTTSQLQPGVWSRRAFAGEGESITQRSLAVGNGFRLMAYRVSTGVKAALVSDTDGVASQTPFRTFGSTAGIYPKCVYEDASKRFLLFWVDGTNLQVAQWSADSGALLAGGTTLRTDVAASSSWLDARFYTSANVTVVYRMTGGDVRFLEVNPTSLALATNVDLGVNCDTTLALAPDPDASGTRFVMLCTSANTCHMTRVNTSGTILTDDTWAAGSPIDNMIGCAYASGAGWEVVYGPDIAAGVIKVIKKYGGTVGSAVAITPSHGRFYWLDSNAWREPGTDAMRFMMGIHVGDSGSAAGSDFQHTYFEMAIEYDNGSTTPSVLFTEPQARLLPLNAGPKLGTNGSLPQVTRTGAGAFTMPLGRIVRDSLSAGQVVLQCAVDQWQVSYISTSTFTAWPNLGPGITGSQAAYIPAGSLLQSVNGQTIEALGAFGIPNQPSCGPTAGGGPTVGQTYLYGCTEELIDAAGNVWKSPMSIESSPQTPTGGNTVAVLQTVQAFGLSSRRRVIKHWRTLGNGTQFYLLRTTAIDYTVGAATISFTDSTTDATLALSDPFPADLEAMVTPAMAHVTHYDGRMFGVDRDVPNRVYYTHVIQPGESPSFVAEFTVDGLQDELGDVTGIAVLGDKLVFFKDTAIYYTVSGGPDRTGAGRRYTTDRITKDQGAKVGMPLLSTGGGVYFFGHTGVYRIKLDLSIDFVGEPLDKWFNQSLITTPETPLAWTLNQERNEIRLLTTNYRFVYDTIHGQWMRDTGGPAGALYMIELTNVGDMFIRSNGQVWWDYTAESISSTSDASGNYTGIVRSAWIRPADTEGFLNFYRMRSIFAREPAGAPGVWPTQTVYFDNHDDVSESLTPTSSSNNAVQMFDFKTRKNRCSAFSMQITLPSGDLAWRVDKWAAQISVKRGMRKTGKAEMGRS